MDNSIITNVIGGLLVLIIVFVFNKYLKRLALRILPNHINAIAQYKYSLIEQIKSMPFIYKDIEFEVMEGFVDVEIGKIDQDTLRLNNPKKAENINNELIKYHKILFLGGAGFGKTTLQRYAILSTMSSKFKTRFVNDYEKVIPVFVPLKLIKNINPSPVVNYLITNVSFLSSIKKIEELLTSQRIMLFLDGYDEIQLGDGINYIQQELTALMFDEDYPVKHINEDYINIYRLFKYCRVWLSSRRDFFKYYPIGPLGKANQEKPPLNFAAVKLMGIGNNRYQLIAKIFDRYRNSVKKHLAENLNEEYFLSTIDESTDSELIRLSKTPLFLTVMCYIYVKKVLEAGTHDIEWSHNTEDLVAECINLLLNDLDTEKVRDLKKATIDGLTKRRNSYFEEKLQFLEYFSAKNFGSENSVFSYDYLKSEIVEFLKIEESIDDKTKLTIQNELEKKDTLNPNFALQLVFCGVFVIVQKTQKETIYDFPHRRFKEVLAGRAFSDPQKYINLLENIKDDSYLEFMNYFQKTRIFEEETFHKECLNEILIRSKNKRNKNKSIRASSNFVRLKSDHVSFDSKLKDFIKDEIVNGKGKFSLSNEILSLIKSDTKFEDFIISTFKKSYERNDIRNLELTGQVLLFILPAMLKELIYASLEIYSERKSPILIKLGIGLFKISEIRERLLKLLKNPIFQSDVCYLISIQRENLNFNYTEFFKKGNLNESEQLKMACFIFKFSSNGAANIYEKVKLPVSGLAFKILSKKSENNRNTLASFKNNSRQYFFTTDDIAYLKTYAKKSIVTVRQLEKHDELEGELVGITGRKEDRIIGDLIKTIDLIPLKKLIPTVSFLEEVIDKTFQKHNLTHDSKIARSNRKNLHLSMSAGVKEESFFKHIKSTIVRKNSLSKSDFQKVVKAFEEIDYKRPLLQDYFAEDQLEDYRSEMLRN